MKEFWLIFTRVNKKKKRVNMVVKKIKIKIKLWYFRSKSCKTSFVQIKVNYETHTEGFLATLHLGDDTFTGTGSNKTTAKDKASEEALEILSLKSTPEKKGTEKTAVTELNELCQRLKQVCPFRIDTYKSKSSLSSNFKRIEFKCRKLNIYSKTLLRQSKIYFDCHIIYTSLDCMNM